MIRQYANATAAQETMIEGGKIAAGRFGLCGIFEYFIRALRAAESFKKRFAEGVIGGLSWIGRMDLYGVATGTPTSARFDTPRICFIGKIPRPPSRWLSPKYQPSM